MLSQYTEDKLRLKTKVLRDAVNAFETYQVNHSDENWWESDEYKRLNKAKRIAEIELCVFARMNGEL